MQFSVGFSTGLLMGISFGVLIMYLLNIGGHGNADKSR
ncbi:hypothetical protein V518_0691 [Thermoanaerobacterium aotearoense SCUT27]|uniref:Uncharacterized protein n=3 Tax=Thermoanaerobacterium TaxID=28895 RepID=L0INP0_THETR|nr:hypothetical protein Tsac_2786 [Thermoanaerobacterium saccharolyticum JW/SL-YS485]AGB20369.1 hypothetical protein Thethe_02818 [Thermoanaerobacterium thermosaccharolyticum M0795]ETO39103.1 hypothetical protein V518_0691 [Thermoanaerobacterium aotearoense SCUT27]